MSSARRTAPMPPMVAAQRFKQQTPAPVAAVFGCATTGANWRFLRLTGTPLTIDLAEYSITQPDRILGVLLYLCGVTV